MDPNIRQRQIRRAIAREAVRGAWAAGHRDIAGIELEGAE